MNVSGNTPEAIEYTPTVTGFSTTTVEEGHYTLVGKLCTLTLLVSGTSNATTFTVTLPFAADDTKLGGAPNGKYSAMVHITNNGTNASGWLRSRTGSSNIADVYATAAGGAWTASGTKELGGTFIYYIV